MVELRLSYLDGGKRGLFTLLLTLIGECLLGIIMNNKEDYYVYLHRSKVDNAIFYVGKGRCLRHSTKTSRGQNWHVVAEKGYTVELYAQNLTNSDAYTIEQHLIETLPNLVNKITKTRTKEIDGAVLSLVYYDETSPTCLRYARPVISRSNGRVYKNAGDIAGIEKEMSHKAGKRHVFRAPSGMFYVHRLVYALHYPISAEHVIDHIDGDTLNNKITNLRQVTQEVNSRNTCAARSSNSTGVVGVSRIKREHLNFIQYIAHCRFNGKLFSKEFSCFNMSEEQAFRLACEWRNQKIKELNEQGAGYTERHGT